MRYLEITLNQVAYINQGSAPPQKIIGALHTSLRCM